MDGACMLRHSAPSVLHGYVQSFVRASRPPSHLLVLVYVLAPWLQLAHVWVAARLVAAAGRGQGARHQQPAVSPTD